MKIKNLDYVFGIINKKHKIEHACHSICVSKGYILKTVFNNFYNIVNKIKRAHQICFYKLFKNSVFKGDDLYELGYYLPFYITSTSKVVLYIKIDEKIDIIDINTSNNILMPIQYYYINKIDYPNKQKWNNYKIY